MKWLSLFGSGWFIWPHGIDVDPDGNVWVTYVVGSGNIPDGDQRGHLVYKFSPTGEVLLRLGTPGMPAAVGTASTSRPTWSGGQTGYGQIFVADLESDNVQNPGWDMGIWIGDGETGWVTDFTVYQWGDPAVVFGNGAECVAVDRDVHRGR